MLQLSLVLFGRDKDDRQVLPLILDLVMPFVNVDKRVNVVDSETEHDNINLVGDLHPMVMPCITTDINDSSLNGLLLFCDLRAMIEVDHCGLVVVDEVSAVKIRVARKVFEQGALARVRVANHSYLYILDFFSLFNNRHFDFKLLGSVMCLGIVRVSA